MQNDKKFRDRIDGLADEIYQQKRFDPNEPDLDPFAVFAKA